MARTTSFLLALVDALRVHVARFRRGTGVGVATPQPAKQPGRLAERSVVVKALPGPRERVRLLVWVDHRGRRVPENEDVGTVTSVDRTTFHVQLDSGGSPICVNPALGDTWAPEHGAVVLPFTKRDEELRALVAALLDCIVLGHAMCSVDWQRLLVLAGREQYRHVNPCKIWVSG
jgi:hypothetical protein